MPATSERRLADVGRLSLQVVPVLCGAISIFAQHRIFQVPDFGSVVTLAEMTGQPEYTSAGRYQILPVPSLPYECIRPFLQDPPAGFFPVIAALAGAAGIIIFCAAGWNGKAILERVRKLKCFAFLLLASILLYVIARIVLLELFLPSRYLEYSLTVFYCVLTGVFVRSAADSNKIGKYTKPLLAVLVVTGALRLHGVALFDYGNLSPLYGFFQTTPKDCLIAGHPSVMDNVMTFSRRKVFLGYELSHPWYGLYWSRLKPWTNDFFQAYYAEDADEIRSFCRKYAIDYFVVRERDFIRTDVSDDPVYFEPFGSQIRRRLAERAEFAALDEHAFKILFQYQGIRVLDPFQQGQIQ